MRVTEPQIPNSASTCLANNRTPGKNVQKKFQIPILIYQTILSSMNFKYSYIEKSKVILAEY